MKTASVLGVALIILGIVALLYQGFTYTRQEKVVDVGPVEVTKVEKKRIPLPPVLGSIALVGGILLVAMGTRRS